MRTMKKFKKDFQYYRFCAYGFLKNLRFFEPFLLLFFLDTGLSYLEIGILYSTREIVRNLSEIPSGFISDLLGRRKTMVASFGLYIASFINFYLASAYGWFFPAIILFALGDAFRTGTHKAMIFSYLKMNGWQDQKTDYYGHTRSWSQMGSAVSSLIAGGIIFLDGDYRSVFLFTILPYVIDMVNIATYPSSLEGLSGKQTSIKATFKKVWLAFKKSFNNLLIIKTLANTSSHSGYFKAVKDYLQPLVKTLALSVPLLGAYAREQQAAVFIGIIYFVVYLITSRASWYSGQFKSLFTRFSLPLNITMLVGFACGVLGGILYEEGLLWASVSFFMAIFIMENLRKPIGIDYVSNKLQEDAMATALSVESQSKSLIAAVLAPALGYFSDSYGVGYGLAITSSLLLVLSPLFLAKKASD